MSPVDDSSNVIPHGAVQTMMSVQWGTLPAGVTWSPAPLGLSTLPICSPLWVLVEDFRRGYGRVTVVSGPIRTDLVPNIKSTGFYQNGL